MAYFLTSWHTWHPFLTSWCIFLMSGHNSWHYIMTYFPYFMIHVLTVWCSFWRHHIFLDIMTCFMTYIDVSCFNIHTMAAQNIICLHFGSCMKNWFSNCFPLLYICLHGDEGCICWHFGAPDTPGFYVRAQHDPEKEKKRFIFFILKLKRFLSYCFYIWHAN